MRLLSLLVAVFGVVLAGGALILASWKLGEPPQEGMTFEVDSRYVHLLVAKDPLPYAATITADKLVWKLWPRESVPEGAFTSVEHLLGPAHDFERRAKGPIEKNEPILLAKITEPGERLRMQTQITAGMVAVSISVNAVTSVSGFVQAGDRVDVNHIVKRDDEMTSRLILQNVLVRAVDQSADTTASAARPASTVTVEVSHRDAQLLSLAQITGSLSLILRGNGEAGEVESGTVTERDLDGRAKETAKPQAKVTVRKQGAVVETIEVGTAAGGANAPAPVAE